jgi:iron complex outermembrane receptor protein
MKKIIALSCIVASSITAAEEISVTPIVVKDKKAEAGLMHSYISVENGISSDGGGALSTIPGISIQRKGGHGNDPVIRGQKENRLNIKVGDRFIHGGCPSRMDPPSSYVSTEIYENIEVHRGVYTLTEGRGGPAGTIIYTEKDPKLEGKSFAGKVGFGFEDNTNTKSVFTLIDFGSEKFKGRVKYAEKDALDYKDGDDEMVESSFNNQVSGVNLYWSPNETLNTVFKYEVNKTKNARYSALSMDAPKADLDALDLKITKKLSGIFEEVEFSVYQSNIEHLMDNKDRNAAMVMEVDSESKTIGARLMGTIIGSDYIGKIGIDSQNLSQLAEKKHNSSLNTYMWPDAEISQTGIFAEIENSSGLKYGIRIDTVTAEAKKADDIANTMAGSASSAYKSTYGANYEKKVETNVGALIRYTKEHSDKLKSYIGVSKTARTADANERFIHKFSSMTSGKETGNPDIKAEQHTQIDLGFMHQIKRMSLSASVYYNDIKDFITVDKARGQTGVTISDNRTVYRNIDAKIMGIEFETKRTIENGHFLLLAANYTYGENTSDKRTLYEIPPVEYRISHGITKDKWSNIITLNGAASQPRVDSNSTTGSGVDYDSTKGWLTADITATYKLKDNWNLSGGIKNMTNETFSKHLNMRDILTTEQTRVNEPGRSIWINTVYTF